jgi:phage terminase large subunit-like protein
MPDRLPLSDPRRPPTPLAGAAMIWRREIIDASRARVAPALVRTVIAIDPPLIWRIPAHMTGMVVAGCDERGHAYVTADLSRRYQTDTWAMAASKTRLTHNVGLAVTESGHAVPMVEQILRVVDPTMPLKIVHVRGGRSSRAEPLAVLYERGLVHHVGEFLDLEIEMCLLGGMKAPADRVDALIVALTELMIEPPNRPSRSL